MVPITFVHGWDLLAERDRLIAMREFAANGARHLVLSDAMMKLMDGDYFLPRIILKQAEAAAQADRPTFRWRRARHIASHRKKNSLRNSGIP